MLQQKLIRIIFVTQTALAVVLGFLAFLLYQGQQHLTHSREVAFRSYLLADELRQSSDDLTRVARSFVATGNPEFERQYNAILDIRNGKRPRPVDYNRIYWDLILSPKERPRPDGEAISLHDLMVREGFTAQEFERLEHAQQHSDALVKTELIAMNAAKGWFDDGTGHFTVKGEPDRAFALDLMHNEAYQRCKAEIMKPIDDFYVLFQERTARDVAWRKSYAQWLLDAILVFIGVLLAMCGNSFVRLRRQAAQQERAKEALRTASLYARTLLETSLDPLVTITAEGKIADVNAATERITGRVRNELIGSDFSDYFTDSELARAGYRKVFAEGTVTDYPLALRHSSGEIFEVLYNASVYRNEQGEVLGVFAAARDITARRRAEEERIALENQLHKTQKNESLGRMAGAVAHNFNNQFQAVLMNLEYALDTLPAASELHEVLQDAYQAVRRAADLSSMMLTYVGQAQGTPQCEDLTKICQAVLARLMPAVPKTAAVETAFPEDGPMVTAIATHMEQILTQLLTNAWEALGGQPGVVRLSVCTVTADLVTDTNRWPLDWRPAHPLYACLEVADTGCGISSEDLENLFDPFFSTKFMGRGLGLAAVLGFLRANDAALTVESHPGTGSRFRVFYPVCAEEQPQQAAASCAASAQRRQVLLVEDEDIVRKAAAAMLAHLGFQVVEAADGAEALKCVEEHRNSLGFVLCDLSMPVMDGWQTLEALRAVAPQLPVILVSGYDYSDTPGEEHRVLPQAFLTKPYRESDLRNALKNFLPQD